jgi:hypothetical protein
MIGEVLDTNVLAVANDRGTHAPSACIQACIRAILSIQREKLIVIDDGWRILGEYQRNASSSGQPGVGDAFLLWLLRNHANPDRCERVSITPRSGTDDDFNEFPDDPALEGFDRADRKFVAVALASVWNPEVLNATDTDWHLYRETLARHGVRIRFLCPELMISGA